MQRCLVVRIRNTFSLRGSRCAGAAREISLLCMSLQGWEQVIWWRMTSHVDGSSKCSMTKIFSLQGGKKLEGKMKRWMKGRLKREYSWIKRNKKSYLCCMNVCSSESVSGRWHTNKMDQYLFGKCNLMYFLILGDFVYRIQSLFLSAIWWCLLESQYM